MILFISPKYGAKADSVRLIEAARKRNIRTETLLNSWNTANKEVLPGEEVAVYGEHAFCEFIAQEMRWNLYQNSLDWIAQLPLTFTKRTIRYLTLEQVIATENSVRNILGQKVLEPADDPCFMKGIHETRFPKVPQDTPILVSMDHEWTMKYRYVIIDRKIATSCCYRVQGIYNEPAIWESRAVMDGITPESFVHTLLDNVNVAPSCVIDIGYLKNAGWAVSGTKPIWMAELYGCSPSRFLDALFASCKRL